MPLPSVDQRVAYLEGRTGEHAVMIGDIRADMRDLRSEMRGLRSEMSDLRSEMGEFRSEMLQRFEHLDTRFNWVIGLLFAVVLAMVSAAIGAYTR
jgi:hypothetical protein